MRILITGGAGFIGSNLTKHYLENTDHEITVVDRNSTNVQRLKELCKDLREFNIVEGCFHNVRRSVVYNKDAVVHLAAVPHVAFSVENPAPTTYENIYYMVRLLDEMRKCPDTRFVFASSSSVYGDATLPTKETHPLNPQSPYALQKKTGEEFCRMFSNLYEMDTVCLRFFNVFGPYQHVDSAYATVMAKWCDQLKKGEPLLIEGDGTQSRDFSYVDNVVRGIDLAVTSDKKFKGDVYNIANQDRTSLNDILDFLYERFDSPDNSIKLDKRESRVGDVKHTQAYILKAKTELNYSPVCDVWEGLNKTLEWWNTL